MKHLVVYQIPVTLLSLPHPDIMFFLWGSKESSSVWSRAPKQKAIQDGGWQQLKEETFFLMVQCALKEADS